MGTYIVIMRGGVGLVRQLSLVAWAARLQNRSSVNKTRACVVHETTIFRFVVFQKKQGDLHRVSVCNFLRFFFFDLVSCAPRRNRSSSRVTQRKSTISCARNNVKMSAQSEKRETVFTVRGRETSGDA